MNQLSNLFTYTECRHSIIPPEVIFRDVTLLEDLITHKNGTFKKGTEFYEVYFNILDLKMEFLQDYPHGIFPVAEITVKIEKEDR